jgi:predicted nucleic acid-binding protein
VILVDTSVWVDHLRRGNGELAELLDGGLVLGHPFIIGEVALGHLRQRDVVLGALQNLPQAAVANDAEVLTLIGSRRLFGLGIGYLDAHLLAASQLSAASGIWTLDKRLHVAAVKLRLAWQGRS